MTTSHQAQASADAGPHASPGFWLHHTALAWRRELGVRLRDLDLTPTQFDVLGSLSWQSRNGEVTQQMVADLAGIDRMMASKVIAHLEQRELVQRRPHPRDRRASLLELTDAGREAVRASTRRARALDRELFGPPGASAGLRAALAAILDDLQEPDRDQQLD